jgi:hypothetical protein
VAIVCAGAWAFYTFIYQEKIKPANEPAALNATISVRSLAHDRTKDILGVEVVLRNTGKTEIDMAADAYNVWGERYADREAAFQKERSNRLEYRFDLPIVSRRLIRAFAELRDRARGGRIGTHIILEPGESESIGDVIAVPHDAYDVIHAQVVVVPVKTSAGAKIQVSVLKNRGGSYWLVPAADSGAEKDDNDADFALPQ